MTAELDLDDVAAQSPGAMRELAELRRDAERLDWLAERLEDVQIAGADPWDHFQRSDGADEPWPVLWRRAIDAAMAGTQGEPL